MQKLTNRANPLILWDLLSRMDIGGHACGHVLAYRSAVLVAQREGALNNWPSQLFACAQGLVSSQAFCGSWQKEHAPFLTYFVQ